MCSNIVKMGKIGDFFEGFARILFKRNLGKISFWDVRYKENIVQIVLKKEQLVNYEQVSKFPIGSIMWFTGKKVETSKNKHSILVNYLREEFLFGGTMPDKHHGLSNSLRYRHRVKDLISNEASFDFFKTISKMTEVVRLFLYQKGYREFNTGVLQEFFEAGQAKPFFTKCNANGKKLYLSLTSELKLKRLMAGGFEKVFEISQSFRNEGLDAIHSPEFSLLEFYAVNCNFRDMMVLLEEMLKKIIFEINGTEKVEHCFLDKKRTIVSYEGSFERMSFRDAFEKKVDSFDKCTLESLIKSYPKMFYEGMSDFTWLMKVIEKFIVPSTIHPIFLTNLPVRMSPFVKVSTDGHTTERVFLISQGLFLADIYTDENNKKVLKKQSTQAGIDITEDYLQVLSFGLPKTAGVGLGMNRLFMLFLNNLPKNIKETILYPLL